MQAKSLTRKEQKLETRRLLVETAQQLFARHGIVATATAEVAETAGVSHGTVFMHFPRREDLVIAVIEEFGAALSEAFDRSVSDGANLRRILEAHLQILSENEDFYYHLLMEMNHLPPAAKGLAFMINSAVSWKMYEAAQPLMKSGEYKKMERGWLFNTWAALLSYYISNRSLFVDKPPILQQKGADLIRQFLFLIKK